MEREHYNKLSGIILRTALTVHKELGPGLLESIYEDCLISELREQGIRVESQVYLPLYFKNRKLNKDFRIDLLVEDEIIIEIKSVENLLNVHEAQILSYMKLANKKLGLLINFNVALLKDGFQRYVRNF